MFLQNIVVGLVAAIPRPLGRIAGSLIMVLFLLDFVTSLYREKRGDAGRNLDGQAVQSEEAEKTGKTF